MRGASKKGARRQQIECTRALWRMPARRRERRVGSAWSPRNASRGLRRVGLWPRGLVAAWACGALLLGVQAEDHRDLAVAGALADGEAIERGDDGEDAVDDFAGRRGRDAVLVREESGDQVMVLSDELGDLGQRNTHAQGFRGRRG